MRTCEINILFTRIYTHTHSHGVYNMYVHTLTKNKHTYLYTNIVHVGNGLREKFENRKLSFTN